MKSNQGRFSWTLFPATAVAAAIAMYSTSVFAVTLVVDQAGTGQYVQIASAVGAANSGDTVRVLAGTYLEQIVIGKAITLSCEGPDLVTIQKEGGDAIVVQANQDVTITGCRIIGSGGDAIELAGGGSPKVLNNVILGSVNGLRLNDCALAAEIVIRNNVIASNTNDGVDIVKSSGACCSCSSSFFIVAENNIISDNNIAGGCGWRANSGGVYAMTYNNFFGNTQDFCTISASTCVNCMSVLPSFVDQTAGDYHLAAASAVRNQGKPAINADPDGTRNDLGAYGGPDAAGFFPSPDHGPTVRALSVFPSSVPKGGTINLQATGRVEAP